MRILLIEDHCRLAESIIRGLAQYGFGVDWFSTAREALKATKVVKYDATVLDLGLPDRDGLELLPKLRQRNPMAPILILSARDSIDARVTGLDAGADGYMVKPFAMQELAARLKALLRRPGRSRIAVLKSGNLCLDVGRRQVTVRGSIVPFSPREVEVLEILMRRQGEVTSKAHLEEALRESNRGASPNSVEALVSRLRRRMSAVDAACKIHTLHGIGYLLKEEGSSSAEDQDPPGQSTRPHRFQRRAANSGSEGMHLMAFDAAPRLRPA
jgi:DNA-binding response OmpR family regulator